MAISSFLSVLLDESGAGRTYRLDAVSDVVGGRFYWYEEGQLFAVTGRGSVVRAVPAGLSVSFEVFDASDAVPEAGYPPRVVLQWEAVPGAVSYRIVRAAPGDPVLLGEVVARQAVERWESGVLDAGAVEFEIYGVFGGGVVGLARSIPLRVVRRPGAPSFTVSYVAAGGGVASGEIGD